MRRVTRNLRCDRAGSAQIEFALCGIFVVFLLISIFDMARGLWINHTLAESVRTGVRFAIVRGDRYATPGTTNRLPDATLDSVRRVVMRSAIGLVPDQLTLRFESGGTTITCAPANAASCGTFSPSSTWPPAPASPGMEIGIAASYPYNSFVVMYFPGGKGVQFGRYILGSTARERIVF